MPSDHVTLDIGGICMSLNLYPTTIRRNSFLSDFDNIFGDMFRTSLPYKNNKYYYGYTSTPKANVEKTEAGFCLSIAVPGYSREDFDINVENGVLTVSSESSGDNYEPESVSREYRYQPFSRSWSLPETVNVDNINARYEAGILNINIPIEGSKTIATKINVE